MTVRAVCTGVLLGGLLSTCNVYVSLKTGVAPNMSITAALLGFGLWGGTRAVSRGRIRFWGVLENNICQVVGSSGALVASAGLAAPIPALAVLTGRTLPWHWLALWLFSVMLVGIAVAVPLRRQMIFTDKLPFPSGVATAEMLREMHARGTAAIARVLALVAAGLVAAGLRLAEALKIVASVGLPFSVKGFTAKSLSFTLEPSLLLAGIGGLIGFRTCCSLLAGAVLAYGLLGPRLVERQYVRLPASLSERLPTLPAGLLLPDERGRVRYDPERQALVWQGAMSEPDRDELLSRGDDPAYREAVGKLYLRSQVHPYLSRWLLWPGAGLIVVASVVSLGFSWRSILAVLPGRRRKTGDPNLVADQEDVPRAWFVCGWLAVAVLSVVLQTALFGIAWWAAVIAVLLAFPLAAVAARVAGETGVSAVGAMGKVTQLVFGGLVPKNPVPNLMAANVAGGAASQCADLLDDLKCGHLLGASPRWLTLAQVVGALAGALAGSAAYLFLIPHPAEMLMGKEWPAPAAASWKAVAELFQVGFRALPEGTPAALALAALAGVALPVAERMVPRRLRAWLPSAASLGLGFVLPAGIAISIFVGGLAALLLRRWFRSWSTRFLVAVCAGLIAGESLAGVGVALVRVLAGQ